MTEAEWFACTNPKPMLEFLRSRATDRKLRLFAVACCRRVWDQLDEEYRAAVEFAELFAEGRATEEQRSSLLRFLSDRPMSELVGPSFSARRAVRSTLLGKYQDRSWCSRASKAANEAAESTDRFEEELAAQAVLLREIIGNPFHPVVMDPLWLAWNDSCVVRIAQAVYDGHTFEQLQILADALEDAGCTDADILGHLRGPGPHVRGCWVLDALLGRD
jgi:hypothetical protein